MNSVKLRYQSRLTALHLAALRVAAKSGHIRRASIAIGAFFPSRDVEVPLDNGRWFTVPSSDVYWSRLLVGWDYEPGVRIVIDRAINSRPDAVFLDCGANFGYWSVWVSDRIEAVAVEAVPSTYTRLKRNAGRNGFTAINAAVWKDSTEPLDIQWDRGRHEAASVIDLQGRHTASIRTVTLDELAHKFASGKPVIAKLDIEGAEAMALAGASAIKEGGLFIFEDHGSDQHHTATRAFLQDGFHVHHIDGPIRLVASITQLDQIKSDQARGYNFVASRSLAWSDVLRAA